MEIIFYKCNYIYGVDILPKSRVLDELIDDKSIQLYCETNAYDYNFIKKLDVKFDFLLDDGPHTLQSQINFITLYSPLLNDNGILIVEDVQKIEWLEHLKQNTPKQLKPFIKTYNLIKNKNRYYDIVFTIDKINI